MLKRSVEGSIERALEESWYPNELEVVTIYRWFPNDATREFSRTFDRATGLAYKAKTKWINKIRACEKIIKSRMMEALTSDSEYVRTYAELLVTQAKLRKENVKLRAASRRAARAS